jgi:hypothetical protein
MPRRRDIAHDISYVRSHRTGSWRPFLSGGSRASKSQHEPQPDRCIRLRWKFRASMTKARIDVHLRSPVARSDKEHVERRSYKHNRALEELVRCGLLRLIDHEHLDLAPISLEPQPELFTKRSEEG